MSFRLVSSGGGVVDPAVVTLFGSGTIRPGDLVDYQRTAGIPVSPTTSSSTSTMVFGLAHTYKQGASDAEVNVTPVTFDMLFEVDCANAATSAQIGLRHALSGSDRSVVHNTGTDVSDGTGIFLALKLTGSTSGSGKLIGKVQPYNGDLIPVTNTTFLQ